MPIAFSSPNAIAEIQSASEADLTPALLTGSHPCVLRGLVSNWPVVQAGLTSNQDAANYLCQWANDNPVQAFVAPAKVNGRYFYNEGLDGFNFTPQNSTFKAVINDILQMQSEAHSNSMYLGSTSINHILPEFRQENDVSVLSHAPLVSIWCGNQSRIAAHYDIPDNLACNLAGKRRFVLFPPEQLANLYVGPLDYTPAGQSASLVDFHQPDYARFPKFKEAIKHCYIVELAPGDALFIPSMWWHHVEGLTSFNVLMNYWWRQVPHFMGSPLDALNHALLSIRDLPESQRDVWRDVFEHYVFSNQAHAHIPEQRLGSLKPLDETRARQLRAQLINKLNR